VVGTNFAVVAFAAVVTTVAVVADCAVVVGCEVVAVVATLVVAVVAGSAVVPFAVVEALAVVVAVVPEGAVVPVVPVVPAPVVGGKEWKVIESGVLRVLMLCFCKLYGQLPATGTPIEYTTNTGLSGVIGRSQASEATNGLVYSIVKIGPLRDILRKTS